MEYLRILSIFDSRQFQNIGSTNELRNFGQYSKVDIILFSLFAYAKGLSCLS